MLEHANSNQIHLTCVPYREPQAQPVVVNINQTESLPMLIPSKTTKRIFFCFYVNLFLLLKMILIVLKKMILVHVPSLLDKKH